MSPYIPPTQKKPITLPKTAPGPMSMYTPPGVKTSAGYETPEQTTARIKSALANYTPAISPTAEGGNMARSSAAYDPSGKFYSPTGSGVGDVALEVGLAGLVVPKALKLGRPLGSLASKIAPKTTQGVTDLASKLAGRGAPKTLTIPKFEPGPMSKYTPKSKSLEVKTTGARTKTIDTSVNPVPRGTVRSPIAKTAIGLGAIGGIGAAGIGLNNLINPSSNPSANQNMAPEVAPTVDSGTQSMADPNGFTGEFAGYPPVIDSPVPAPQTGTGQGGALVSTPSFSGGGGVSGGIGTGVGGSGGSAFASPTKNFIDADETEYEDEEGRRFRYERKQRELKNQREREDRMRENALFGGTENANRYKSLTAQEQALSNKINKLASQQQQFEIDLETSPASTAGRQALRGNLDAETRKQLVPLQTMLASVQAEMARLGEIRSQNQAAMQEQTPEGFTLGQNQVRYEIDPATGEYIQVGANMEQPEDAFTYDKLSEGQQLVRYNPATGQMEVVASVPKTYAPTSGGGGTTGGNVKLGVAQQEQVATMDTVIDLANQVLQQAESGQGIPGVGAFGAGSIGGFTASKLGFGGGGDKGQQMRNLVGNIQATIAKMRGGTSFTANEETLLSRYTPTVNDSDAVIAQKLRDLISFTNRLKQNTVNVASGASFGTAAPQTVQEVNGFSYAQGPDGNWYLQE